MGELTVSVPPDIQLLIGQGVAMKCTVLEGVQFTVRYS